jgi:hypothetical protein
MSPAAFSFAKIESQVSLSLHFFQEIRARRLIAVWFMLYTL